MVCIGNILKAVVMTTVEHLFSLKPHGLPNLFLGADKTPFFLRALRGSLFAAIKFTPT